MLPELKYDTSAKTQVQTSLKGINYSDNYDDGAMSDSMNLSSRRYPYIATKFPRRKYSVNGAELTGVSSIYAFNGLWYVKDGGLYRINGDTVTTVIEPGSEFELSADEKQFAAMYHKLVIFPDKIFIDTDDNEPFWLEAGIENVSAEVTVEPLTDENAVNICTITLQMPAGQRIQELFQVYDIVTMSGWTNPKNNMTKQIIDIPADNQIVVQDNTMEAEAGATISIEREVPDLDFICEHNNKLYGVSNKTMTMHISAVDDPRNWSADQDAGGFAVGSATEGEFTGCASLSGSVVFFKEHSVTKILGDYASEYQTNNYEMEGVRKGCHKSVKKLHETVYFLGCNGVFSYNGGTSSLISYVFGEKRLKNGVAGSDGTNYYLSAKDGETPLFLSFNLQSGIWLREDDFVAKDFALNENTLYVLDADGNVWLEHGNETDAVNFSMTFKPFYETSTGSHNKSMIVFANKRYVKVYLRTEMSKGAYCKIEARLDGGVWREVGRIVGKGGLSTTPVPIGRCDKYELRLSGKGPFTLLNLEREFRIGSAK